MQDPEWRKRVNKQSKDSRVRKMQDPEWRNKVNKQHREAKETRMRSIPEEALRAGGRREDL